MIKLFFLLLFTYTVNAQTLEEFLPEFNQVEYSRSNGSPYGKYTFQKNPSGFQSFYKNFHDLGLIGDLYLWKKEYWQNGQYEKTVDQILFLADDGAVYETGGWRVKGSGNVAVGYKLPGTNINSGLIWAGVGNLSSDPVIQEFDVIQQTAPGTAYAKTGQKAYSKSGLVKIHETFTPKYGRDANGNWCEGCANTYTNVAEIIMYHGTRPASGHKDIRCGHKSPVVANGPYYQSLEGYNTYSIRLWIAEGIGIIQHSVPFIEDGAYWGSIGNCSGNIFDGGDSFVNYIDEE